MTFSWYRGAKPANRLYRRNYLQVQIIESLEQTDRKER